MVSSRTRSARSKSGRYDEADESDAVAFTFDRVKLDKEEFSDGYIARGLVTADAEVPSAAVVVILFGADHEFLGYTYTNLVDHLAPGKPKAFETVTATPPLDLDEVEETIVAADQTF